MVLGLFLGRHFIFFINIHQKYSKQGFAMIGKGQDSRRLSFDTCTRSPWTKCYLTDLNIQICNSMQRKRNVLQLCSFNLLNNLTKEKILLFVQQTKI